MLSKLDYVTCYCFSYAEDVSVNDEVLVQGSNNLVPAKVIKVSNSVMQGNYNVKYKSKIYFNCNTYGITSELMITDLIM